MERITIRMPAPLIAAAELAVERGKYADRSAAIRDAIRQEFDAELAAVADGPLGQDEQPTTAARLAEAGGGGTDD